MDTTRLLIVEDEALFSELLRRTLSAEPGLEVVGTAEDGETAIALSREADPDAVIMDISLAGEMDGVEAALRIKQDKPETGIVVLSAHKDRRYVTSLPLDEIPGWAYLLKQSVPNLDTLVRAIQGSIIGMVVLDPEVVMSLQPRKGSAVDRLTPRLQQVLELIAQGYNNAAVARTLTLSERSVETYINGIYQELSLSNEPDIHARVSATPIFLQDSQDRDPPR